MSKWRVSEGCTQGHKLIMALLLERVKALPQSVPLSLMKFQSHMSLSPLLHTPTSILVSVEMSFSPSAHLYSFDALPQEGEPIIVEGTKLQF